MATQELEQAYLAFSKGEKEMDGRLFTKLCKDAKLYDKSFTATDADLLFAKVKPKGGRKIDFKMFQQCLDGVAAKRQCSKDQIVKSILEAGGPMYSGTKALPTKFHDDKQLYTGVHARGGPSTVDTGRTGFGDLSEICDRSSATVRGVNVAVAHGSIAAPKSRTPPSGTPPSGTPPSGTPPSASPPSGTPHSRTPPSSTPPSKTS